MEVRVELVLSGDRTRTTCTHERTCVGAAYALTNRTRRQTATSYAGLPV